MLPSICQDMMLQFSSVLMTSDLDIYRTANVLVKHYGEDAAIEAAQRADAMLEKGSLDGNRLLESPGT